MCRAKRIMTRFAIALMAPLVMCGCIMLERPPVPAESSLRQLVPAKYPVFEDYKDRKALIRAAEHSLNYLNNLSASGKKRILYPVGNKQITPEHMAASLKAFIKICQEARDNADFRKLIEEQFDVYQSAGSDDKGKVVFTTYYEPVLKASKVRTKEFQYPIYKKPSDLVEINLDNFNSDKCRGEKMSARVENGKAVPYFSREDIDIKQALKGLDLEIAWFKTKYEITDLHVEGSAILEFTDGDRMRAHYAGTNGLPFKGPVTTLVSSGVLPKEEVSPENAKKYLEEHPEIESWLLATNKRYNFFEITPLRNSNDGPMGTIGEPLVAGRSVAVDPQHIPLGAIAYMEVPLPRVDANGKLAGIAQDTGFVLCQDTGGAIRGAGRVDYYAGTGSKAKTMASNTWSGGKLFVLVLKLPSN